MGAGRSGSSGPFLSPHLLQKTTMASPSGKILPEAQQNVTGHKHQLQNAGAKKSLHTQEGESRSVQGTWLLSKRTTSTLQSRDVLSLGLTREFNLCNECQGLCSG